jgi:hypothetical protein
MDEPLTEFQKAQICTILLLGNVRATACKYLGISADRLEAEAARDAAFARDLLRAEAEAEMRHMANVHTAAKDEKNWRTSVWWLERNALDGDDGRRRGLPAEVCATLAKFADIIVAEITDLDSRESLRRRLLQLAEPSGKADA